MKTFLFLLTCLLTGSFIQQAPEPVRFQIRNAGFKVDGTFTGWEADIHYDEQNPERSTFQGVVRVASINTGIQLRDKHLKGPSYFDAETYPEIRIKSKKVQILADGSLQVSCSLTIRNKSKDIMIPVRLIRKTNTLLFETEFSINRRDYGVGGNSLVLSDDVRISVRKEVAFVN